MNNTPDNAIVRWQNQVTNHHKQSISMQKDFDPSKDFWKGMSWQFKDDPFRKDDPVLQRLICEFYHCETVLDIGGGAGRFALPLALTKKTVTVADSSQSMLNELSQSYIAAGIKNVRSVLTLWEKASLPVHDGILCSHVTYGIEHIKDFILNLNDHVKKKVVVLSFMESPQTHLGLLWETVHGEKRIHLPGVPELMDVLWDLNLVPELSILETNSLRNYESYEDALNDLRRSLYINLDTEKDQILNSSLKTHLLDERNNVMFRYQTKRTLCLIRWNPD